MLEKTFRIMFKGVHSKILFFCLRLSQVNFQLFHSRKFQPPRKCPLSWTGNSCRKRLLRRPPFWNCLGSEGLFPKLTGRTKTCNWRDTFTRSTKSIFFQAIIQFFNAIIRSLEHVWLKIIWLKRSCSGQLWEGMTRKLGLAAEYSSKWRQRCSNFGLLWRRIS